MHVFVGGICRPGDCVLFRHEGHTRAGLLLALVNTASHEFEATLVPLWRDDELKAMVCVRILLTLVFCLCVSFLPVFR